MTPITATYKVVIEAYAGDVLLPASQFQCDYELNGIPQASLVLSVGHNPVTGKLANTSEILAGMTEDTEITVYGTFTPSIATKQALKNKPILGVPHGKKVLLFRGNPATRAIVKSSEGGQASVSLQLYHWLKKLSESSILSHDSHPSNPAQYTFGAVLPGSSTGGRDWTGVTGAAKLVTSGNVKEDFWGKCLRPLYENLLDANTLQIPEVNVLGSSTNNSATAALKKFITPGKLGYKRLGLELDIDVDVADRIAQDVALLMMSPAELSHQTVWDSLVSVFSQQYLFAVVPRPDDAVVVPYVPTMKTAFKIIDANGYTSVNQLTAVNRSLRAVGLLSGITSQTGAAAQNVTDPGDLGIGGWFEGAKTGMILIQRCPRWMTGLISQPLYAQSTSGIGKVKSSSLHPRGTTSSMQIDKVKVTAKTQVKPLLNRYAEAIYELEAVKGRQLTITCPLRFDIAPGSSIMLEGTAEGRDIKTAKAETFFGSVLRVSIQLSSEQGAEFAGTAMVIGHLRSIDENEKAAFSSDKHPVWTADTFTGCALIDI